MQAEALYEVSGEGSDGEARGEPDRHAPGNVSWQLSPYLRGSSGRSA